MQVRYIANSCFVITLASGRVLLTDPWFAGPAQQTWWNFPPLHDALRQEMAELKPDWIYISHLHEDHLHPATLALYPRETPVLIGRMNTPGLSKAIRRLGFDTIWERDFEEAFDLEPGGCRAMLFSDFHATTTGEESVLDYDLDTSIYLFDADGTRLFNAVDNTIQAEDARRVRERCAAPHVAIAPYASASLFPMSMSAYDDAAKQAAAEAIRPRAAARFAGIVKALGADIAVPAGGEYVLGGPAAALTRFLPQPLPHELERAMRAEGVSANLAKLYPGDVLDAASGDIREDPLTPFRGFDDAARTAYAETLAEQAPEYAALAVEPFRPDWPRMLVLCGAAFISRAVKVGYAPTKDLVLQVRRHGDGAPLFDWALALDTGAVVSGGAPREWRDCVIYQLDERLLFCLVSGLLNWNAIEASCLLGLERRPDVYDADLHRLIVYFSLLS